MNKAILIILLIILVLPPSLYAANYAICNDFLLYENIPTRNVYVCCYNWAWNSSLWVLTKSTFQDEQSIIESQYSLCKGLTGSESIEANSCNESGGEMFGGGYVDFVSTMIKTPDSGEEYVNRQCKVGGVIKR